MFQKHQPDMMRKYKGLHTATRMTETLELGKNEDNVSFLLDLLLHPAWSFDRNIGELYK
jgi:hypothetical protein